MLHHPNFYPLRCEDRRSKTPSLYLFPGQVAPVSQVSHDKPLIFIGALYNIAPIKLNIITPK